MAVKHTPIEKTAKTKFQEARFYMGSSQISSKRNLKKNTGAKTKFLKMFGQQIQVLINSLII